nr:hypothetical protein [Methylorubrum aminovorans]
MAARVDRLADVGPRGELILASGRRAVLSGLRWPDEPAIDAGARAWLLTFRGAPLTLTERGAEDRWGRRRADGIAGEAEPIDLAGGWSRPGSPMPIPARPTPSAVRRSAPSKLRRGRPGSACGRADRSPRPMRRS